MYLYVLAKEYKYLKYERLSALIFLWVMIKFVTDWGAVSYYSKINLFYLMIYYLHIDLMRKKYPNIK